MTAAIAVMPDRRELPALTMLIEDAARTLNGAQSAAQVLDARDKATFAYDEAKRAARLAAARNAHDEIVARIHRAQAQALEIEAGAKRRLADEYDAAQNRGEVAKLGTNQSQLGVPEQNTRPATVRDIGLTRKQVHEARQIRDAEVAEPGVVHRIVNEAIEAGEEPTKAKVRKAVREARGRGRPLTRHAYVEPETQHDRDLRMLTGMWDAACPSARDAFLKLVNPEEI